MAIFRNNKKDERELGFGSQNYRKSVRFINKDGSVNVQRRGLGGFNNLDLYHWLTSVSGTRLSVFIIISYTLVNLIFGGIYYLIGAEHFDGVNHSSEFQKFLSLFFFSAQTITTLGYGHLFPISNAASSAAAAESLLGLLSFAIATGVIFGRFSRPQAHILYSKNILIAPYGEIKGLMFRISNKKQYELIESEANLTMSINNPVNNKREFFNLALEIKSINFLALSWTIVHPINDQSPIFGLSAKELEERDAEFLILIKAINDTFSQTVYSRYSYKPNDIVENAKFRPLVPEATERGKIRVSVTDIHHFDAVV
ncbi:MAG: ion channel [bacterium]|nr:ion channel [bacterium]